MRVVSIAFFILFVPCVAGASAQFSQTGGTSGVVASEGTHFEITDSEYLNISLDSTEVVKLRLESKPRVITMRVRSVSASATSTEITILGLLPHSPYYKYEDNLHNLTATSSDENGTYSYTQDLSKPHIVFIQPNKSTKFISNNATGGDCASFGIWDIATLTCTLTSNVSETIQIDSDDITLDGDGHTQDGGQGLVNGVYLEGRTGVTIKNLILRNFFYGIFLYTSSQNVLTNNSISNTREAILLDSSSSNTLKNSTFVDNLQTIVFFDSNFNTLRNNEIDVTIIDENIHHMHQGIVFFDSMDNFLERNNITMNYEANPIAKQGILLFDSYRNIISKSTLSNMREALLLFDSGANKIYHHNFINNSIHAVIYDDLPNKINLPLPSGGNYWDTYDEPAEGCDDANANGICDAPYVFEGGKDNLPLTSKNGWESLPPACTENCPSNVLFLPGIEGSRLYEGTGCGKEAEEKLWEPYDSLWKAFWGAGDAKVKDLFLDVDGRSVCSDIYTKPSDVIDSVGGSAIYASLIAQMNGLKSDGTLNDWKSVAYDWRLSLYDLLNSGVERAGKIFFEEEVETPYIEQTLRTLAESSKTGKVTIVAHSNGGLVTKALLNRLGDEASSLVDKVVMVGVPQSGAPEALGITLVGHNAGIYSSGFPVVSNVVARELAQNLPMAYHLLPSQNYFDSVMTDAAHPVARFAGDGYPKEISAYGPVIGDLTELDDFLLAKDGGREKPKASDLSSAEILNESLIYGANDQHDTLDTWVPPAGIEVSQIAGWGADTVAGIDFYTLSGVSALSSLAPVRMYKPIFTEDGDGTVPVPSALLMSTSTANVKRYWVNLDSYRIATSIRRAHGDIFEIPSLEDFVKNIIKNSTSSLPAYISSNQPPSTSNKKLTFFLHSPLTLELTDASGNITGLAEDGSMTQDIPDSSYGEFGEVKYVTVPQGSTYQLTMHGQDNGTFSLDMQESSGGVVTNSSTIANVPTTENTLASLTISDGIDTASPLTVDKNGDGKNIFTVTPKVGETVNYEPPAPAPVIHSAGGRRVSTSNPVPSPIETIIAPVMSPAVAIVPTTVVSADTHQIKKKSPTPVRTEAQKKALNIPQTASVYDASQQPVLNKLGGVVYYSLHRLWTGLQRIFHLK